jgi:hypothetical protein
LANLGSEIREFHDLQTHRSWRRSFTGNLVRISRMRSKVRVGSDDGDVRVLVKCCLLVEFASSVIDGELTASFRSFSLTSAILTL